MTPAFFPNRSRRLGALPALLGALLLAIHPVGAQEKTLHEPWSVLVRTCVVELPHSAGTAADYACFASRRAQLAAYLDALSSVSTDAFETWGEARRLAFLINAYNAWTVDLILGAWPELDSIRDLGSLLRSPWQKSFIPLLGEKRSLDDIEHGMIRAPGRYDEPRIHFAVNCASVGCPALRREAYGEEALDAQLEDQTRRFLADRERNRLTPGGLEVSPLFKWYREDFEAGWRGIHSLNAFLASYGDALGLDASQREALQAGEVNIDFLDYDWSLNQRPPGTVSP